jgi:hypothetical protein
MPVVMNERIRRTKQIGEAAAFGCIFRRSDGLAVALDEAGDGAILAFDDFAHGVAAGVDLALPVADGERALGGDDTDFVVGRGLNPGQRRSLGHRRLRQCRTGAGEQACSRYVQQTVPAPGHTKRVGCGCVQSLLLSPFAALSGLDARGGYKDNCVGITRLVYSRATTSLSAPADLLDGDVSVRRPCELIF